MTRHVLPIVLAVFVTSACAKCARQDAGPSPADGQPEAPEFTLVFTAGAVGYLEPCGCSPDQRGGVARAATAIEEIRASGRPVLLVDGGDRFFPGPAPSDELAARQQSAQARTMAEVTRTLGYDALVLGARDAGAGATFFGHESLPPLLDTGSTAQPGTKPSLVKTVGGVKVGLFAVGRGDDAEQTLKSRAAAVKSQGAQVVVLIAYRDIAGAKALVPAAKAAGVDFILASRAEIPETHEAAALADLQPPIFTPHARGESFLRLDVRAAGSPDAPFVKVAGTAERESELDAIQQRIDNMRVDVKALGPDDPMRKLKTEKLLELEARKAKLANAPPPPMPAEGNAFTYAFVPMTPQIAQEPKVRAIVDAFDRRLSEENLAYAKAHPKECPAAPEGQAAYVGDQRCIQCHAAAYAFWKGTGHAHAYETLVEKGKQYNVQCISCHVTGWEKPGGACSIAQVEGRKDVQCESCHGPGSLHAESGEPSLIALHVPEATCKSCHDVDNSPHFNDATYRPRIIGPGHGQPLPKGQ